MFLCHCVLNSRLLFLWLLCLNYFITLLLQRLQSVQNAAARLVTRTGRREHISPVLRELHWLPVRRRLDFKLATLMFKSLHGCAPLYLSDACQSTKETSHRLRSSSTTTYVIPRTRTRLGDRAFDVAGPRLWNNLPASLRSTDSIAQFRKQLKTYLFRDWDCGGLVTFVFRRRTKYSYLLTYLLTKQISMASETVVL